MDLGIRGYRALVAGGSRGIGLAAAELLLAEGARVAILARDKNRLRAVQTQLTQHEAEAKLMNIRADATDPGQVVAAVRQIEGNWGGVDILVNAAGRSHRGYLDDVDPSDWEHNWRVNVLSCALLSQAVKTGMAQNQGGRIIFLGAASAKQPTEGQLVSNVHKAGLLALAKSLANELAPDNILVNVVCPGRILGPRRVEKAKQESAQAGITVEEYYRQLSATIPLGRLAEPHEVASLIVFLCSKQATYITGQAINGDGGLVHAIL